MLKKNLLALAATVALACPLSAAITIQLQADMLKDTAGAPMPTTGLFLLVASINNTTLEGISAGASTAVNQLLFTGGDDYIIARGNLAAYGVAGVLDAFLSVDPDTISAPADTFQLAGWENGDTLALFWFPTLTLGSSIIPAGTPFGSYTRNSAANGTSAWITPAEPASNYKLGFFTTDGGELSPGATAVNSPNSARASQSAVPEPSTLGMAALGVIGLLSRRRRN